MIRIIFRALRAFAFFALVACAAATTVCAAQTPEGTIVGRVVDAVSGLPVPAARIALGTGGELATSDARGAFALGALPAGTYRLRVVRAGYREAESERIVLAVGATERVTLALALAAEGAAPRTIATTSIRAAAALQRSATTYRTLSPDALLAAGAIRFGDALRTLPQINNAIAGDTAALSDDLQLNVRGLGTAETTATLDGHPIGLGIPGGFNYQLTPLFGLRNVVVTYGSGGSELTGVDAIGAVVDAQTLDPTPERSLQISQGYGSFDRALTSLRATGTAGRVGYALAAGVGSLDGPFHHAAFYQPGAAYDPSATDPAVRRLAIYGDDSSAVSRGGVAKLRYALSRASSLTLAGVASSYWEDKTGNGDGDYLDRPAALALGNAQLAAAAGGPCGPGRFAVKNAGGVPWGTGPGGVPDGGNPCQTPDSYANAVTGFQGAGPAWQSFSLADESVRFETAAKRATLRVDAFTNFYRDTVDRTFALPFVAKPGDNGFVSDDAVSTTGVVASETFAGPANEFSLGGGTTNFAYRLRQNGALAGTPLVHENSVFIRDAYHPERSPLAATLGAYLKHSTVTNTSYVDPRLSLVYTRPSGRDVVRVAAGATTTQPTADALDRPFVAQPLLAAGGGGGISCGGLNSIGNAPSSLLRPERGVDEEFALGHRFGGDSTVQLTLYNTNVYDKIYATVAPLGSVGTNFVDAATLRAALAAVATCGNPNPLALLGVSGNVNLGALRARGFTLGGRARLTPRAYLDYDYSVTSTVLHAASDAFLRQNLTYVIDAQLPRLPLHTFALAADAQVGSQFDVRYTLHVVGDNNTKRVAGYNYSDLLLSGGLARGHVTLGVSNLFDQNADIRGLLYEGRPLALNAFATAAQTAPYTGAGATERFGLPYRAFFVNYSASVR